MLEKINLNQTMSKEEYETFIDEISSKLALLQRKCKDANIPIMILFEGWGAAGKGTLINKLISPLDPRGFKVFTIEKGTKEERYHPYLWRFWTKTPAKGRIHILDLSYYSRVVSEREEGETKEEEVKIAYEEIMDFEQQLVEDGTVIIKFFLHISKKEQERRFEELEKKRATAWRVTKKDWKRHNNYHKYLALYDEMLARTDTDFAPWSLIESTDKRYAAAKILATVSGRLEDGLRKVEEAKQEKVFNENKHRTNQEIISKLEYHNRFKTGVLSHVDLTKSYTKQEYKTHLKELQNRLSILHNEMYLRRIPVVVAFEGWDASGKGGAIKRLTQKLDPRGYEVVPVGAPNDWERAHHYLWRFWNNMPKAGHMTIFDRTWYGRVLVERVEGFCTEEEYKRAYNEINHMEEQLTNYGCVVVKFWLHIDKAEQEKRFHERQENPDKQWKITEEDWRNREKWDDYESAVDEMIVRTSTVNAPWVVVEANSKYYARIKVLETVVKGIEEALKR